jgi:alginate O-acetyltransferase complex protein AlgI
LQFPTLEFAYFLLVVITVSWALRGQRTAHKLFLLAASYFFCSRLHWGFAAMLFASSLANWAFGEAISRAGRPSSRRGWLLGALATNLGVLGAFKYYGFFRESVGDFAALMGLEAHLPVIELLLPVGLSFYTFQGLAYVFDLYRGRGRRARSTFSSSWASSRSWSRGRSALPACRD